MSTLKNTSLEDRRGLANAAKQAQLEKFRLAQTQVDEETLRRRAERQAVHEARVAREAEKEAKRRAEGELRRAEEEKVAAEAKAAAEIKAAEDAAREAARPNKMILEAARYAEMRASRKGGKR
jgi:hypothetical protein